MSSSFEIQILRVSTNYLLLVVIYLCCVLRRGVLWGSSVSFWTPRVHGVSDPRAHGVPRNLLDTPCARGGWKSLDTPCTRGPRPPCARGGVFSLDTPCARGWPSPCARGPMGRNVHPAKYALFIFLCFGVVDDPVHLRNLPPSVNSKYHLYSLTIGISSCGRTLWSSSSRLVLQLALSHCLCYLLSTWVR